MTPTQSIGFATQQYLLDADCEKNSVKTHVAGRILLLGTTLLGLGELVSRLALYCIGQVGAFLTLYQSDKINDFVGNQVKAGFDATIITTASLFSQISPNIMTRLIYPQQIQKREIVRIVREENWKEINLIIELVKFPFELIALTFKIPFLFLNLGFQMMILPLRIALLPFQIMDCALRFPQPARMHLSVF